MMRVYKSICALLVAFAPSAHTFTPFGNSWCGKPYEPYLSPVNPGGQTPVPTYSSTPLLDVTLQPRYNLYLASEHIASFIVDVPLSHYYGVKYEGSTHSASTLNFQITITGKKTTLAKGDVRMNTTANEVSFSLSKLTPRFDPYSIVIVLTEGGSKQTYTATTQLYYLPDPKSGSVTKVDNLYQGLLVSHSSALNQWTQLFPYGWYSDSAVDNNTANADAYLAAGYNFIHFVPDDSKPTMPFAEPDFTTFLDRMDEIGLYLVYDMRGTYMNLSLVMSQVESIKNRKCLLMYYTADEPDGWSYPLNSTQLAYSSIKSIDPYHPVSLVLNCIDFYYEPYTLGADIVLEDAYPIGINATFSTQFDTPCTPDYGDCGCDGCIGSVTDVSTRIDILRSYQEYYNQPKPIWAVPQAFGNNTYWTRYPTGAEEVVMQQLAINHHGMGVSMWIYPSSADDESSTSAYAKVVAKPPVSNFLLNSLPTMELPVTGATGIDASVWTLNGKSMVGIVNENYYPTNSSITINKLPGRIGSRVEAAWGTANGWIVHGTSLVKKGTMKALEVDILILT